MSSEPQPDLRYERKFVIEGLSISEVEFEIKLLPEFFSEIYHERYVNNLYLDTQELSDFLQSVEGAYQRKKTRIRWYGDLLGEISNPKLEIKHKQGLLGYKDSYNLPSFNFTPNLCIEDIFTLWNQADLPQALHQELQHYRSPFINRYQRRYFLSADQKVRMTLDWNIRSYQLNPHLAQLSEAPISPSIILELKYPSDYAESEKGALELPYRLTRSSKYVSGRQSLSQVQYYS